MEDLDRLPSAEGSTGSRGREPVVRDSEYLQAIVDSAAAGIVTFDASGFVVSSNRAARRMLGFTAEEASHLSVFDLVPALHPGKPTEPSSRSFTTEVLDSFATSREAQAIRLDGTTVPLQIAVSALEGESFSHFVCTLQSSGVRKQPEEEVLEALAQGEPLPDLLTRLACAYEAVYPEMLCSVLLLDEAELRLLHGAGPSLPLAYTRAIDNVEIGPTTGSCGTAAFTGKTTLVDDIENDPLWRNYKELALSHGLRGCWSVPIRSSKGRVLGTLAFYFRAAYGARVVTPTIVERAAHLASVAIERHQTVQSLKQSEERLRLVLLGSNDASWDWDLVKQDLHYSPRWWSMLGYGTGELHATPELWATLRHPDDVARVDEVLHGALHGGLLSYEVEFRLRHKNGHYVPILSRAFILRDPDGRAIRVSGTNTDLTERKRAEEALRESRERFDLAVRGSTDGIWDWNLQTGVTYLSERGCILVGHPAEASGWSAARWEDVVHPDDRAAVAEHVRRHLEQREAFAVELRARSQSGEYGWFLARGQAIWNDRGQPSRISGSLTDITGRKKAEEQREALEIQLRQSQKLEAVGQLAGGIAHDFNNLLTVITAATDLALMEVSEDAPLRDDLLDIRHSAERGATLTQQLLTFSRNRTLQSKILNLNALLGDLRGMLERLIGGNLTIVVALSNGPAMIEANAGQIDQVVLNLALNARDAMPNGGTLGIETREVVLSAEEALRLGTVGAGRRVVLTVRDEGIGMDDNVRARIFEPFFTTKEPGKGTGLGLASVYGIVKQIGAGVGVETALGKGTAFSIYFSAPGAVSHEEPKLVETRAEPEKAVTILVVEDEEALRRVVKRVLEASGFSVFTAANGVEALQRLEEHKGQIDLVVTDVVMPEMGGIELAERLALTHPSIKVLCTSGYTGHSTSGHPMLEPSRFLPKPFKAQELLSKVQEVLASRPTKAVG